MDNKQRINENTAKIEALAQRLEEFSFKEPTLITKEITANGTYNASDDNADGFDSVVVNVASSGSGTDRLQWKCDNMKTLAGEFNKYTGTSLDDVLIGLDTSKVTDMGSMFSNCSNLTAIPQLDTSKVTNMSSMFNTCSNLTTIPQLDTSNVTSMSQMFYLCSKLTTIPQLDTSNVTSMTDTFNSCRGLITIMQLDMIKLQTISRTFASCTNLTNLTLKNIKVSLYIADCSLLTDESLINTAKELWDLTGSTSQKLTVSTTRNARFDAIYVKLVDVTDEMVAQDQYITNKKPCVVCESTDAGAMTLREYVVSKNWTLA